MITKNMATAINDQIKHEMYSSWLYLAMAAWCEHQNLKGFGHWMRVQADEERGHAMKFFEYLLSIGEKVQLDQLDRPPADFGTPKKLMEQVLEHERKVTGLIHKLYDMARTDKDYRSEILLQWFVTEQIEEEENALEILTRIEQVEERLSSILWIDKELKKRDA